MIVYVLVEAANGEPVAEYWMDHNDPAERKVLGMQCRNAFEAHQSVWTCPVTKKGEVPE